MNNRDIGCAQAFHESTKHSPWSIRATPHYLDWANQPLPFKIYTSIEPVPLPRELAAGGTAALSAISQTSPKDGRESIPTLNDLASILYFSAGITKRKRHSNGEIFFRAASCTGALYEFELYAVCRRLQDLNAGIYHFSPGDFALRLLRAGDFLGVLAHATANEPAIEHAPVVIICAGTYWRNSWKYRARTYRHFGWDNGTILANMLAIATALNFPAKVVCGFLDQTVNALLDLDTKIEVAFSMVPVGYTAEPAPEPATETPPLNLPIVPLSGEMVDYPELHEIHEASVLTATEDVRTWRAEACSVDHGPKTDGFGQGESLEATILRRGSSRGFRREPIRLEQLTTMLGAATQGIPADFLEPFGAQLNDVYLIVNAVDGLQPGAYFYDCRSGSLELLREGIFREEAQYLGLQQSLPGDASADVFFLADLNLILKRFGNRGYRAVQLEAGILGGKLYLAAYAQHLGATGLTFFDDDVTRFFSPHAAGKSAIFLVALGRGKKL